MNTKGEVRVLLVEKDGKTHEYINGDFVPPFSYRAPARKEEEKKEHTESLQLFVDVLKETIGDETMPTENTVAVETTNNGCQFNDAVDNTTQVVETTDVDIVRNFLKNNSVPVSRADALKATGVSEESWTVVIKKLVKTGAVVQTGTKRGARYSFVK